MYLHRYLTNIVCIYLSRVKSLFAFNERRLSIQSYSNRALILKAELSALISTSITCD